MFSFHDHDCDRMSSINFADRYVDFVQKKYSASEYCSTGQMSLLQHVYSLIPWIMVVEKHSHGI